jgi:hypothetical protein
MRAGLGSRPLKTHVAPDRHVGGSDPAYVERRANEIAPLGADKLRFGYAPRTTRSAPPFEDGVPFVARSQDVMQARVGDPLKLDDRDLAFSYLAQPMEPGRPRRTELLFAKSPWAVVEAAIANRISARPHQRRAAAFLQQAEDFYATAGRPLSTTPLLYYYAFLNLAKVLLIVRQQTIDLSNAVHGLRDDRGDNPQQGYVAISKPYGGVTSVYSELLRALRFSPPQPKMKYKVPELLARLVIGHRPWREASGRPERVIPIARIEFRGSQSARTAWLRLGSASLPGTLRDSG